MISKRYGVLDMRCFNQHLPETVCIPDDEKKEIAQVVCEEIDLMASQRMDYYKWNMNEPLGELFPLDHVVEIIIDMNISSRLGKELHLTDEKYDFKTLTVNQLVDVTYAKYHNLPLPNFEQPTLIQRFKRYLGLDKQNVRS